MEKTFELGMVANYVKSWGVVEAVREIYQNCIDESIVHPDNPWFSDYDPEKKILRIGNKGGVLEPVSLLLGSTTKDEDNTTVGEHGEGYKIAIVVLVRTNHPFTVYNTKANEVWTARMVNSRRYGTKIVAVDVKKSSNNTTTFNGNKLIFEVANISQEEYDAIVAKNLWLQQDVKRFKGVNGDCLTADKEKGNIYVNGLFVRKMVSCKFGWDFKPSVLKLDRDRQMLDIYDITRVCSILAQDFTADEINQVKSAPECRWLTDYLVKENEEKEVKMQKVFNDSYEKFKEENGEDAVPVNTDYDFNRLAKAGKTCIKLDENEYKMVTQAEDFKVPSEESSKEETLEDLVSGLENWYNNVRFYLTRVQREEFEVIMNNMKEKVSNGKNQEEN